MNIDCSLEELELIAKWHCAGEPLEESIGDALALIGLVRASPFWNLVRQAEERMVEVPLAASWQESSGIPTITRGIVDLALRFPEGWHIIDYKSDIATMEHLVMAYGEQTRTYAALWGRISGERVAFAGLYSVREQRLSADLRSATKTAV
jgi:ATP-dependent exoDNAse (exonuclease V) beta subunit